MNTPTAVSIESLSHRYGKTLALVWNVAGTKDSYAIRLENSVLLYRRGEKVDSPDATLTLSQDDLIALALGQATPEDLAKKDGAVSNSETLKTLLGLFDNFKTNFDIVTP